MLRVLCHLGLGLVCVCVLLACEEEQGQGEADAITGTDTMAPACLEPGQSADPDGVYTLPEMEPPPMPGHDPVKMDEHMAAHALVAYTDATHAVVANGFWCNPETWHNRSVPGEGARVVIPAGFTVTYDIVSDVALHTVRVDGTLRFDPGADSRLVLDTLLVDGRGTLEIGTLQAPVAADNTVEMMFAANGDIDVQWDPMLFSRGLISHGAVSITGARKQSHLKVAVDPVAGDASLELAEAPEGWRVGDTIVVAGTRYIGWAWDNDVRDVVWHGTQDEVRTIASLEGTTVGLNAPLEWDHTTPRDDFKTSVANFTRNVRFATQDADQVPSHQRGHTMFMHSQNVDVRYAEFFELGRTRKDVESFDVEDVSPVMPDSNIRARYPLHFHRTGTANQSQPGMAVGNAVFRSPGWGFVHHDSHADFFENASFDTFGAGFVAETGNETGIWARNIAIRGEGNSALNPKNGNAREAFDMGRTGDGFWFQGRMVRAVDNVAASVNHGFVYFHRGTGMKNFPADSFQLPEALGYAADATPDDAPIRSFDGNEAFASTNGLFVVKANPKQQHDVYSTLNDFTAWEVRLGAQIEYTSHYLLRDFDLVGAEPAPFFDPIAGIVFGNNTTDTCVRNARLEGFPEGIVLSKTQTADEDLGKDQYVVVGATYIDVDEPLPVGQAGDDDPLYQEGVDQILEETDLVEGRFELDVNHDEPYTSTSTAAGSGIWYVGNKTDAVGTTVLPTGADELPLSPFEVMAIAQRNGYLRTSEGTAYVIIEQHFSDRASGDVHKVGFKMRVGPEVDAAFTNTFSSWGVVGEASGTLDLASQAPDVVADTYSASGEVPVVMDLVANDTDPDGDALAVDGILQPRQGRVLMNEDGTATYYPSVGFSGFKYWATDGHGNYTPGWVTVEVE